jgi:hypothetical protein
MPQPAECAFRESFDGGAPSSLSSKDEFENDCSGGGPPSESEPPRMLAGCRARVGTAGAAVAGCAAAKECQRGFAQWPLRPRCNLRRQYARASARAVAGCRPRRRIKANSRLRLAREIGGVVEAVE